MRLRVKFARANEISNQTPADEARHEAGIAKIERQLAGGNQKVFPKETTGERLAEIGAMSARNGAGFFYTAGSKWDKPTTHPALLFVGSQRQRFHH